MLLGLEGVQGDIYLGPLVDLNHELDEEGALCQGAEVDTQVAHLDAVFQREVGHDPRNPKDSSDTPDANVRLVLLESLISIRIHSMHEQFF